jgi:O-acetylhomoserine (thiol)-lyase
MSAIASVVMGLLKAGDELVAASGIFGGTVSLFQNTLAKFGVKSTFVDAAYSEEFKRAITKNTKLIFIETIGNPKMDVPDISAIADIAKQANIPFVVDNTVTTPALYKPGSAGADIVIHSTTKFINGHGTAMGGAIIDTGNYDWRNGIFEDIKKLSSRAGQLAFLSYLRSLIYRDLGGCPAPMNSFLMLQGLETLPVRMKKHCSNAVELAKYLQGNEKVAWVNYPGLKESAFYDLTVKQFDSVAGAMLTFGTGDKKRAFKFIDSLKLANNLANLGDAKTAVIHPESTIFHEFSIEEQKTMGVTDDMVRVSVGIEDFEDIKNDFEQAINKAFED